MSGVRLAGKVCVITGGAGGIGTSAAELFMGEGATVVGVDLVEGAAGHDSWVVDVTDSSKIERLYASVVREHGGLDVLFNNAGISPADDGSVLETDEDTWQRVQDVNLKGVFLCSRLPQFVAILDTLSR